MSAIEGWDLFKLPKVVFFQEGPGLTSDRFTEDGIPFINYRCIKNGKIDIEKCQFVSKALVTSTYQHFLLKEGDWVFSSSGTIGKIAKIGRHDLPLLLNTSVIRFRTLDSEQICDPFVKVFLESPDFEIQHKLQTQGSAQVNLGPTHLNKMQIWLPPLPEQAKIAEILSTVDRGIAQTEALIAKQQRIKTGLMADLLTRGIDADGNLRSEATHAFKDSPLGRIPVEWEVNSAHELCKAVIDCKNRTPPAAKEGHPVIRTPNVRHGKFVYENLAWTDSKSYSIWTARGKPQIGDVVITREAPFGEACQIPDDIPPPCLRQRMMMYQTDESRLLAEFLVFILNSERVQTRLFELAGGSTVGHIRVGDLRSLSIPHPKLVNEQLKIANILTEVESKLSSLEVSKLKLRSIKTALMQDLLTGEKRVTSLLNEEVAG